MSDLNYMGLEACYREHTRQDVKTQQLMINQFLLLGD